MNFSSFEKGLNEAPNYSPERIKAHSDKSEKLRQEALSQFNRLQKFLNLKPLGGQQLDNAEDTFEDLTKALGEYFDHIKTAP
jgi:hypothetical protein